MSEERQNDSDGFDQLGRRLREERHTRRLHTCHKILKLDLQQDERELRHRRTSSAQNTETVGYGK